MATAAGKGGRTPIQQGAGADLAYECAGLPQSLDVCWEAVKREGALVPVRIDPGPIKTHFSKITMKELSVFGSFGYVWTSSQRGIRLLTKGKIDAEAPHLP